MYSLAVKTHIDAAHYIKDYKGKCSRTHGHRWEIEVLFAGRKLDGINMLIDFALVKVWLRDILEDLDHYVLNEQFPKLTQGGESNNVTAEYLAKWLFLRVDTRLKSVRGSSVKSGRPAMPMLELGGVKVCESPDCCVVYSEEDNGSTE